MGIRRIYLVRHGETDYNVEHRWQGHMQTPLNKNGENQVEALGQYFKTIDLDIIVSSDLVRAYDTAKAVAEAKGMDIVDDVRWREFSLGVFEGKTRDDLLQTVPDAVEQWNSSSDFAPAGGESRNERQRLVYEAWLELSVRDDVEVALVVSHGGTLRMLMHKLFPDYTEKLRFGNTSITMLEKGEATWQIASLNTSPHLNEV